MISGGIVGSLIEPRLTESFKANLNLVLGACAIAVPQFIIFMALFLLAGAIYPLCTETMICDFKACGGVLLIATGFRMMKLKEFPIADMIPAMVLVMPLSHLWVTYVLPLVS